MDPADSCTGDNLAGATLLSNGLAPTVMMSPSGSSQVFSLSVATIELSSVSQLTPMQHGFSVTFHAISLSADAVNGNPRSTL